MFLPFIKSMAVRSVLQGCSKVSYIRQSILTITHHSFFSPIGSIQNTCVLRVLQLHLMLLQLLTSSCIPILPQKNTNMGCSLMKSDPWYNDTHVSSTLERLLCTEVAIFKAISDFLCQKDYVLAQNVQKFKLYLRLLSPALIIANIFQCPP